MAGWRGGQGAPGVANDGGGGEEGGAGLWSGSSGPTGPGSAGGTSAAPPCRRHSGHTHIKHTWIFTRTCKSRGKVTVSTEPIKKRHECKQKSESKRQEKKKCSREQK